MNSHFTNTFITVKYSRILCNAFLGKSFLWCLYKVMYILHHYCEPFFCFLHSQLLNPSFCGSLLYGFGGWLAASWVFCSGFWVWSLTFRGRDSGCCLLAVVGALSESWVAESFPRLGCGLGLSFSLVYRDFWFLPFFDHSASVLNKNVYYQKLFWKKGCIGPESGPGPGACSVNPQQQGWWKRQICLLSWDWWGSLVHCILGKKDVSCFEIIYIGYR